MSSFKLDFSEVKDFSAIPDGDYEIILNKIAEDASPSGSEYINFDLIIRNDIQQERQNAHLFHRIWKSKSENRYNKNMVMQAAKAFGLPDGKQYESFDDFLGDFVVKPARVTVKNETSEYNGKTYENTNVKFFNKTNFPDINHVFKSKNTTDPSQVNPNSPTISDENLPF